MRISLTKVFSCLLLLTSMHSFVFSNVYGTARNLRLLSQKD